MANSECGICLESVEAHLDCLTSCCKQHLCHNCFTADCAYKEVPVCPFCREKRYEVQKPQAHERSNEESHELPSLDGIWDVDITEKSSVGETKHKVTVKIVGDTGKYHSEENESHYQDGDWSELSFGHTNSGKSFVARQRLARAPTWTGGNSGILGAAGLLGRLIGPNAASFTTSMTVEDYRSGDELEIVQRGEMRRRSVPW